MLNLDNKSINHHNLLPDQFIKYVDYELSDFEKLTNKKFFFNMPEDNTFQLNVYESKDEKRENERHGYEYIKSRYQMVYRTNDIYQFIKRLLIFREHLVKNFDNKAR